MNAIQFGKNFKTLVLGTWEKSLRIPEVC